MSACEGILFVPCEINQVQARLSDELQICVVWNYTIVKRLCSSETKRHFAAPPYVTVVTQDCQQELINNIYDPTF